MTPINVSMSQIEAYQKCERFHMFTYGLNLTPTEHKTPITLGTIGHRGVQAYYQAKMDGYDNKECIQAGMLELNKYMGGSYHDVMPMINKRFMAYAVHYAHDPVEILSVEYSYTVPIDGNINFIFVPDVVVRYTDGPFVGKTAVWETKWSNNFWTSNEVHFTPQVPKYIWGLRALGYSVDMGFINQIRTRKIQDPTDEQLFRRSRTVPTDTRMKNLMKAHLSVAYEILALPERKEWFEKARPSASRMNCRDCFFQDPCNLMLEERDPTTMLSTSYIQRSKLDYSTVGN